MRGGQNSIGWSKAEDQAQRNARQHLERNSSERTHDSA
jgi:hypothetical protein